MAYLSLIAGTFRALLSPPSLLPSCEKWIYFDAVSFRTGINLGIVA